jgi:hypothetical protein
MHIDFPALPQYYLTESNEHTSTNTEQKNFYHDMMNVSVFANSMSEYSGMTEELPCIFHTDDNNKKP